MTQLADLCKPFPAADIHRNPSGGGEYVKHSTVVEKLLYVVGPFSYRIVEPIRGYVQGTPPNPSGNSARAKAGTPDLTNAIVGCLAELTLTIDGETVTIVEVGDCEQPHNWPHDGARLKDASSDAIKRAAMRCGVGLSLWSQDSFRLHDALVRRGSSPGAEHAGVSGGGEAQEAPSADEPVPLAGDPAGAVESPPDEISPTGGSTTTSDSAGGVVREEELALDADGSVSSDPSAPQQRITSARRRLDSARGHA